MSTLFLLLGLSVSCLAYENIALKKPAYQQFPYKVGGKITTSLIQASNAVDGLKSNLSVWGGQCVISENNQRTATWWVNLTSILSIHHITIYYRTGNVEWGPTNGFTSRFLGFSLYVSNSTDKSDGVLCFKDNTFTSSTIPSVFNTTCSVHGQYVIFYNERLAGVIYPDDYSASAWNELCEVEVSGCPTPGYYGSLCSIPCPVNCFRYCQIETGTCLGCKPGYQGQQCKLECSDGFFGDSCLKKCGACADLAQCSHVSGTCLSGCKPGYTGELCMQKCIDGYYGELCGNICGNCTNNGPCHHLNGTCLQGCETGYQPPLCKQCQYIKYGKNCTETCGNCWGSIQCHHVNGSCLEGCNPGFQGEKCTMECDFGYFGDRCLQQCSTFCKRSQDCHHVTGFCNDGCKSGWQGGDCFEVIKAEDSDWKSRFYGLLGAFCITLILIGLLVAFIIIIIRNGRNEKNRKCEQQEPAKHTDNQYCEAYENEAAETGYQELGEFKKSSTTYYNTVTS